MSTAGSASSGGYRVDTTKREGGTVTRTTNISPEVSLGVDVPTTHFVVVRDTRAFYEEFTWIDFPHIGMHVHRFRQDLRPVIVRELIGQACADKRGSNARSHLNREDRGAKRDGIAEGDTRWSWRIRSLGKSAD